MQIKRKKMLKPENKVQVGLGPEFFELDMSSCWWDEARGCWTFNPQVTQNKETKITPENFCFWIQGYFEINGPSNELTPIQVQIIKDHLALVFKKETPVRVTQYRDSAKEMGLQYKDGIDPMFYNKDWNPITGFNQVLYGEHHISC
jgi:hypothetical protein